MTPGWKSVRENWISWRPVEQALLEPSREAAGWDSPARKCRGGWEMHANPAGTAPVLTHTLEALEMESVYAALEEPLFHGCAQVQIGSPATTERCRLTADS